LIGEARWQKARVGTREIQALIRKTVRVPDPVDEPTYAFWVRSAEAKEREAIPARIFDVDTMLHSG
jgi:hypothetical protein